MAEEQPHELLIIKRTRSHDDAHHGGAWKIAFADFMTAMMALFLVLWLISSTNPKTRGEIASYFNPVKLSDMTPMKKGLSDPKDADTQSAPTAKDVKSAAESGDKKGGSHGETRQDSKGSMHQDARPNLAESGKQPSYSEAALFRDPYAVLAEIIVHDAHKDAAPKDEHAADPTTQSPDAPEPYRDPFATIPDEMTGQPAEKVANPENPQPPSDAKPSAPPPSPAQAKLDPKKDAEVQAAAAKRDETVAAEAEANRIRTQIATALGDGKTAQDSPKVDVQVTPEGILISLTDELNFSMFAIGSAEPMPKTIQTLEKIGKILKGETGAIVLRGHTDGRAYRSSTYDNWRLSSARAHMAHYMLVRGGLEEKRFDRVEGYADHRLKNVSNPEAAENRRIEILLRKDKS